MPQENQLKTHILFVDGLRALAALYVVLHHAVLQTYTPDNITTLTGFKKLFTELFFQGHLAVDLFIIISGFSLMLSVIKSNYHFRKGVTSFFKRRAIRILPAYYFSLLVCLLLIGLLIGRKTGTHWDISLPVTYGGLLTHVLLIQDFFTGSESQINHASWSIAVECRIYLFFPLLLFVWRKRGAAVALLFSIAAAFTAFAMLSYLQSFNPDIDTRSAGINPYLILFTLGMLAADIAYSGSVAYKKIRALRYEVLFIIALLLFGGCKAYTSTIAADSAPILPYKIADVLFGCCGFCLLIMCAKADSKRNFSFWITRVLSWRPLVFIGTFSYSLYLIHPPLLQVLSQYILFPLSVSAFTATWLLASFGVVLIIGAAYVFFIFCERPFLMMLISGNRPVALFEAKESPAP